MEQSMRATLLATAILGSGIVLGGAGPFAGYAAPMVGNAPIGHLQPRTGQFAPRSPAEQAEQQRMSKFDVEQQKLDEELDKRLNICRC
jgi:hypothetical protein